MKSYNELINIAKRNIIFKAIPTIKKQLQKTKTTYTRFLLFHTLSYHLPQ